MNATSTYVSTCRLVLQAKAEEPSSWADLSKHFPRLRQSLSCTVCGGLLIEPYTPSESQCQHHVCRGCKGGRKRLKPSCSWCKDYNKYVENVQLRTLLQCYKKLCQYVASSQIFRTLSNGNGSGENEQTLVELIKEGAGFKDELSSGDPFIFLSNNNPNTYTSTSTQTPSGLEGQEVRSNDPSGPHQNGLYSVSCTSVGTKLTLKRAPTELDQGAASQTPSANGEPEKKVVRMGRRKTSGSPGNCQCGINQSSSNRTSCRGYRCPCYSADSPCINCSCSRCSNPNKIKHNSLILKSSYTRQKKCY